MWEPSLKCHCKYFFIVDLIVEISIVDTRWEIFCIVRRPEWVDFFAVTSYVARGAPRVYFAPLLHILYFVRNFVLYRILCI